MAKSNTIELGGNKYNAAALKRVTEQQAVEALKHKYEVSQIRNAWKQANGLSVRNYSKAEGDKPKTSRKRKPSSAKKNGNK